MSFLDKQLSRKMPRNVLISDTQAHDACENSVTSKRSFSLAISIPVSFHSIPIVMKVLSDHRQRHLNVMSLLDQAILNSSALGKSDSKISSLFNAYATGIGLDLEKIVGSSSNRQKLKDIISKFQITRTRDLHITVARVTIQAANDWELKQKVLQVAGALQGFTFKTFKIGWAKIRYLPYEDAQRKNGRSYPNAIWLIPGNRSKRKILALSNMLNIHLRESLHDIGNIEVSLRANAMTAQHGGFEPHITLVRTPKQLANYTRQLAEDVQEVLKTSNNVHPCKCSGLSLTQYNPLDYVFGAYSYTAFFPLALAKNTGEVLLGTIKPVFDNDAALFTMVQLERHKERRQKRLVY
jgi:hypothetical protein